jgi:two-component system, OmpR family, alkaline phosphatase synthesis response regulator PhoP
MSRTILVVDDQSNVRTLLREYLSEEGFRVVTAGDGREALYVARHEKPDLVLLDILMSEMNGYEFIRRFRMEKDTPIILLTARLEETDKVLGLELGADDYVTKPFGMRELLARINAVLRRTEKPAAPAEILRVGSIELDRGTHIVHVSGKPVDLTPSEFELLAVLMAAPRRVFSRLDLLEALHPEETSSLGSAFEGIERTIDVHVRNLRTKIEVDPSRPLYIETIFGVGYRFNVDRPSPEE